MVDVLSRIEKALAEGNLGLADNLCREQIEELGPHSSLWATLARIAQALGTHQQAIRCYARAAALKPGDPDLVAAYDGAIATAAQARKVAADSFEVDRRYLLIRELGNDIWSEVFHVLTAALIAEYSDRIPVVHWGEHCLLGGAPDRDSFSTIFTPLSTTTVDALHLAASDIFPPAWSDSASLTSPSRRTALSDPQAVYMPALLFRDEALIVSDYWGWPREVMSWMTDDESIADEEIDSTLRRLFRAYLRPRPEIVEMVDRTWSSMEISSPSLAIHVKGGDGRRETAKLEALNSRYTKLIDDMRREHPDLRILLLADSPSVRNDFRMRFGDRLISIDRSGTPQDQGTTLPQRSGPDRTGAGALIGALLAARCDYFIGNGRSNISVAIHYLKNWPNDRSRLVLPNMYMRRYCSIYDVSWYQKRARKRPPMIRGRLDLSGRR